MTETREAVTTYTRSDSVYTNVPEKYDRDPQFDPTVIDGYAVQILLDAFQAGIPDYQTPGLKEHDKILKDAFKEEHQNIWYPFTPITGTFPGEDVKERSKVEELFSLAFNFGSQTYQTDVTDPRGRHISLYTVGPISFRIISDELPRLRGASRIPSLDRKYPIHCSLIVAS